MREVKIYLASWRLSAHTGANAREKQGHRRTKPWRIVHPQAKIMKPLPVFAAESRKPPDRAQIFCGRAPRHRPDNYDICAVRIVPGPLSARRCRILAEKWSVSPVKEI